MSLFLRSAVKRIHTTRLRLVVWALLTSFASACSRGALNPQTDEAHNIADLWWLMLGLGTAVTLAVLGLLAFALFRRRRGEVEEGGAKAPGLWFILMGGALIPAVILIVTFGATIAVMAADESAGKQPLRIDIVGHDWWWEVSYPDSGVTTANEIYVPTGRDVEFHVRTDDVIHSFYIPELGRKIDLIPGVENTMRVRIRGEGTWRGQCSEFCGVQHANMAIFLTSEKNGAFDKWLASQQQPIQQPLTGDLLRGEQVFLGSACVYCHTIKGTNASGDVGPDLTHLMGRNTIGAGVIDNSPGHLAGWVVDPQSKKPGNQMPATQLSGQELQDLLTFLGALR